MASKLRRIGAVAALVVGLEFAHYAPAQAMFARLWEPVPMRRLLQNVGAYVKTHPKDAQGYYTLGRLHSLAFSEGAASIEIIVKDYDTKKPLPIPQFPPYATPLVKPTETLAKRRAEAIRHLNASLTAYRKAVALAPKDGLYRFSLAWMLEQGVPFAKEATFLNGKTNTPATTWRQRALENYRQAFALTEEKDKQRKGIFLGADILVSVEAGEGVARLLGKRPLTELEKREVAHIQEHAKIMDAKPKAVTPIVFSLQRNRTFATLLAPRRLVSFDLSGQGVKERWSWVQADAYLLVWDPLRTGRIRSGRQLFGSYTWQMVWRNGYEPLAALDNDRNGWLEGKELAGLAGWRDRNGNAVSEPGEVTPLERLGVVRLRVRPEGRRNRVLMQGQGIQRRDGSYLPTYDWTPTSVK